MLINWMLEHTLLLCLQWMKWWRFFTEKCFTKLPSNSNRKWVGYNESFRHNLDPPRYSMKLYPDERLFAMVHKFHSNRWKSSLLICKLPKYGSLGSTENYSLLLKIAELFQLTHEFWQNFNQNSQIYSTIYSTKWQNDNSVSWSINKSQFRGS